MGKIITRKLTFTLLLILFFAIGILFCWTYSKTLPTFKYTQKLSFQYSNLSKLKPIKKINLSLNQIMELYTSTETVKQQSKPETTAPAITTKTSLQNIVETKKLILVYTSFWGAVPWEYFHETNDYTNTCGCNFDNCELTYKQKNYERADVVLFHACDMLTVQQLEDLKKKTRSGQYWIYVTKESPYISPPFQPVSKFFDLTMTYRYDSDFFFFFGKYIRRKSDEKNKFDLDVAKTKTKQIAWLVSNCKARRSELANYIQNSGLTIAVGGKCASFYKTQLNCTTRECTEELIKYKFYFSAANRLCKDYITEKYWTTPFQINAVPIVLGGSNYSNPRLAVPGSFINAFDFNSPKDLVDYIKRVDHDDKLYNSYFQWKKDYKVIPESLKGCNDGLCDICKWLKNGVKPQRDALNSSIFGHDECDKNDNYFEEWVRRG